MFAGSDPVCRRISDGERVDVVDVFVLEDDLALEATLIHDLEHEDEVVVGARQELGAADHGQVCKKKFNKATAFFKNKIRKSSKRALASL